MTAAETPRTSSPHHELASGLAQDLGLPEQQVRSSYEAALAELSSRARIKEFVPVLALTRVRRALTGRLDSAS